MSHRWRVAVLWSSPRLYCATAIRGIAEYERRYGPWELLLSAHDEFIYSHLHQGRDLDGIIFYLDSPIGPPHALKWPTTIPVVSIEQYVSDTTVWQVQPDHAAAGRMVAEELLKRGFRRLVYCSGADPNSRRPADQWDQQRNMAFSEVARQAGAELLPVRSPAYEAGDQDLEWRDGRLTDWLKSLPLPVGIMAANESRARQLVMSANLGGVRVPQEVAIIGVDNELWSEVTLRGISTVELDGHGAGYAAAQLLHRIMEGETVSQPLIRIPPLRLITRQTSESQAVDDADVVTAIHFIAEHANSGIRVSDVVDAVPLSRRVLERRFHQKMQRSILDEIRSVQMERAKVLLADPSLSLDRIARMCGFRSAKSFGAIFHRLIGSSPANYRKATR